MGSRGSFPVYPDCHDPEGIQGKGKRTDGYSDDSACDVHEIADLRVLLVRTLFLGFVGLDSSMLFFCRRQKKGPVYWIIQDKIKHIEANKKCLMIRRKSVEKKF